jgi:hypothetical protein
VSVTVNCVFVLTSKVQVVAERVKEDEHGTVVPDAFGPFMAREVTTQGK